MSREINCVVSVKDETVQWLPVLLQMQAAHATNGQMLLASNLLEMPDDIPVLPSVLWHAHVSDGMACTGSL